VPGAWCLVAWLVLGFGMAAGLYDAAFATLGRLYGLAARSAITRLTLWGGFAGTVCWPLSASLEAAVGWRSTCLVYAGLQLCLVLPLYLRMVPRPPHQPASKPALATAVPGTLPGWPSARRRRLAILIIASTGTIGGAIQGSLLVHLFDLMAAGGTTGAAAVALGALIGPSQVGARVVEMALGRRYHPIWTLTAAVLLVASGLGQLWAGGSLPALALVCYGAGNGIWSIARGTVPLALFGATGYAVLMGRLAMPSLLAQALAPSLLALLLERWGTGVGLGALALLPLLNVA
jgi:hypothetical protein